MKIKIYSADLIKEILLPADKIKDEYIYIRNQYIIHQLNKKGVRPLWNRTDIKKDIKDLSDYELALIFLTYYRQSLLENKLIKNIISYYKGSSHLSLTKLGSEYFWNIYGQNEYIPNTNVIVPHGYFYLYNISENHPKADIKKDFRQNFLTQSEWNKIKEKFHYRCASCGKKEGSLDQDGKIIKLQKGHKNPNRPLVSTNVIPQCAKCNQSAQNFYIFNEKGNIHAINNASVIKKSSKEVKYKIYQIIKRDLAIS